MPIDEYFQGHGSSVMKGMKKKNGPEAGEREFYATANAKGMKPGGATHAGASAPKLHKPKIDSPSSKRYKPFGG